jgi:hypothetical protein
MLISNVLQKGTDGLPAALRTAQIAIMLPEVQQMLRKLSEYDLGIFMPHMHDKNTGEFQLLSESIIQVESCLEVSFHPREEIASKADRYLPVGWAWCDGTSIAVAACEMVSEDGSVDKTSSVKHKM